MSFCVLCGGGGVLLLAFVVTPASVCRRGRCLGTSRIVEGCLMVSCRVDGWLSRKLRRSWRRLSSVGDGVGLDISSLHVNCASLW